MAPSSNRLAIDLSGSSIRVVEGAIGGVLRCGSTATADGAISAGKVTDPAAVARALKPLLARTEITQTRALVAVSDALATFRIIDLAGGSTTKDVDAAIARELPFDRERTSTRWHDVESSPIGRVVYAAAWDRVMLKNVTDAVRQAGLEPAVVELKSASIARAVAASTCVVVDLASQPAEIVLIDRHLPQVWHAVPPAGAHLDDPSTLAPALRSLLRYYRRRTDGDLGRAMPILISADYNLPAHSMNELSSLIEQPVEALPAPPRVPPQVRHSTYLTCLGLLMRRAS